MSIPDKRPPGREADTPVAVSELVTAAEETAGEALRAVVGYSNGKERVRVIDERSVDGRQRGSDSVPPAGERSWQPVEQYFRELERLAHPIDSTSDSLEYGVTWTEEMKIIRVKSGTRRLLIGIELWAPVIPIVQAIYETEAMDQREPQPAA